MRYLTILIFLFGLLSTGQAQMKETEVRNGQVILNFSKEVADQQINGTYTIKRSKGRLGNYETIGTSSKTSFIDKTAKGNLYDYYYKILYNDKQVAQLGLEIELLGENVYIYSPFDSVKAIGREVNDIHNQMFNKEFSPNRYAMFFKPGDYKAAGLLNIPFYVQIAGLGRTPYEVQLSNLQTPPPHHGSENGTVTFWRSAENLSVIGPETYN